MAHHNNPDEAAGDYVEGFSRLPPVLQSAALNVVHAAQEMPDELVLAEKRRLEDFLGSATVLDEQARRFITACLHLLDAHYEAGRAWGP